MPIFKKEHNSASFVVNHYAIDSATKTKTLAQILYLNRKIIIKEW